MDETLVEEVEEEEVGVGSELMQRLTSRKFWIAVGAFITMVANKQYDEAVVIAMTYLGVEGTADVLAARPR